MMVQSAPAGEPRFICSMAEHNDICGAFARAFGNDRFDSLDPFDEMVYVYRMDGFEEDWQRPTRERRVVYEGLLVGHYTFRVKAVDRDLTYSVSPALLSVTVHASYDRIA